MTVASLGYLRIEATDLSAWQRFGVDVLGFAVGSGAPADTLWLRFDGRPFRLAVTRGPRDQFLAAGWELGSGAEYEACLARLASAGVEIRRGTAQDAAARCVRAVASVRILTATAWSSTTGARSTTRRSFRPPACRGS